MSGTIAHVNHLLESYIDGLNSRRPALFNIYAVCPPEHGVGDDKSVDQSKLAVEGRAYPLFRFDPDAGTTFSECVSLEGNPALDQDWPTYTLKYMEDGQSKTMELPLTFADFAATEARFLKQFRKAPPETWNDDMVMLADFLNLDADEREGKFPYIWGVDKKNRLMRLLLTEDLVRSTEERLAFWKQLKDIAGIGQAEQGDTAAITEQVRAELLAKVAASLGLDATASVGAVSPAPTFAATPASTGTSGGYEAVWVETPECTACDECINIAPKTFAYNDQKLAVIINPKGGKFADIVKSAEKCTAGCIHPGTPWNMAEPGVEKLMARAAKFN
jgi:pyruvate-ferredoxin/flavodoxin oxidoreductase